MEEKMKKGEEERDVWREQRDKLVGQMETILHNLSQENKDLKAQQQTEHDHYSKLVCAWNRYNTHQQSSAIVNT